jgi:hypothetical protein
MFVGNTFPDLYKFLTFCNFGGVCLTGQKVARVQKLLNIDYCDNCALKFIFQFFMLQTVEASWCLKSLVHESTRTQPHPLGTLT